MAVALQRGYGGMPRAQGGHGCFHVSRPSQTPAHSRTTPTDVTTMFCNFCFCKLLLLRAGDRVGGDGAEASAVAEATLRGQYGGAYAEGGGPGREED